MDDVNRAYRTGQKIEIRLPSNVSAEAAYLLVDVLEQIFTQVFDSYDEEIVDEVMRLYDRMSDEPEPLDLDDTDIPF